MDKKELFAARLKDLIDEKELNLTMVENKTGIPHNTLSNYVNAKRSPQIEQLWALSDFFGCTVDYLLGRTKDG